MTGRRFAVVQWHPQHDGPKGNEHTGKVYEIVREQDGRFWLGGSSHQINLHPDQIMEVGELAFGVGDWVRLDDDRNAEIVDCAWHYAKGQPMYFLAFDCKKSSRRYFADELSAAEPTA